jgi:hypothetical protein
MASTVLLSSEARLLSTTAADFAAGGRLTGAGSFTLNDIRLVELQEQKMMTIPRNVAGNFISLAFNRYWVCLLITARLVF